MRIEVWKTFSSRILLQPRTAALRAYAANLMRQRSYAFFFNKPRTFDSFFAHEKNCQPNPRSRGENNGDTQLHIVWNRKPMLADASPGYADLQRSQASPTRCRYYDRTAPAAPARRHWEYARPRLDSVMKEQYERGAAGQTSRNVFPPGTATQPGIRPDQRGSFDLMFAGIFAQQQNDDDFDLLPIETNRQPGKPVAGRRFLAST